MRKLLLAVFALTSCAASVGPEKATRGTASFSEPTLDDPLHAWRGSEEAFSGDGLVDPLACEEGQGASVEEPFGASCRPDTLFTWTEPERAQARVQSLEKEHWAGQWKPLFLTRAPVASFGYGSVSLRIKLQPGVKFRRERSRCEGVSMEEAESTVFAHNFVISEFVICSPKVIHSISYGTKAHYDEMIRDYWQHRHNPVAASYYYLSSPRRLFREGKGLDDTVFSREKLHENLKKHLLLIREGKSFLIAPPDVRTETGWEEEHFRTAHPIYFHGNFK